MIIPEKCQVFDDPVVITDKDYTRLVQHLTGWPRLNQMFQAGVLNQPDLRRLVVIELMGRKRLMMLHRLLGRLESVIRGQIQKRVDRCLRKK